MIRLLDSIKKRWMYYLVALIGSFILWNYIVTIVVNPSAIEKLGILIDSDELVIDYTGYTIPEGIKEFTQEQRTHSDVTLTINGRYEINSFDVFITSIKNVKDFDKYMFLELDKSVIESLFGDVTYYEEDGKVLGINVTSALSRFSTDSLSEEYVLLVPKNSYHLGNLNNTDSDAAISLIKFILDIKY